MTYPIVQVTTRDNLILHGLMFEAKNSNKIVINVHGTASNFYEEDFTENMSNEYPNNNFSFLSTNNRGNSVLTGTWQRCGSGVEKFEDCLLDLDAWIEFVLNKNYDEIILQGHSLGTEKIIYYMNKGKYRDKIKGLILLGFSDSFGSALKFMNRLNCKEELFKEANKLVKENKGDQFLTTKWFSHAGNLPTSAASFLNQFSDKSELSKAFPFREKKLEFYRNVKVPILAVISDNDKYTDADVVTDGSEHTVIPIIDAVELLKKENERTQTIILSNTNHDFEGGEKELIKTIVDFLKDNF